VVTSWWSNCLALTCLHRLARFAPGREILVVQFGKSSAQMERFRAFLPRGVIELHYPRRLLADDGPAREYLARKAVGDRDGAWFVDHDAFLLASVTSWLDAADLRFADSRICLCTRRPRPRAGITQPAYWLSPRRLPSDLSSFSPVPFEPKPFARRPDLHRHDGNLTRPRKDTLVKVREELQRKGMVGSLSFEDASEDGDFLPRFPPHIHLGGLHLYTGPTHPLTSMPRSFFDWRRHVTLSFDRYYATCPPEWLAIEDPALLRRQRQVRRTLGEIRTKDA
jgi:hypothetical protein